MLASESQAPLSDLTDDILLARVRALVERGNRTTAELLAHLAEMDERRLHLSQGCSSMFAYLTEVLNFSEAGAYHRYAE